jgi:hypothetical protein
MAKSFSVSGLAAAADATHCSGSVGIATADSAIAARLAAPKPDSSSGAAPTAAIRRVRKDDWIIATGNASIAAAVPTGAPQRA